jgi:hypothetical protein
MSVWRNLLVQALYWIAETCFEAAVTLNARAWFEEEA